MNKDDITIKMIDVVSDYLVKKAFCEVMQKSVQKIQRQALVEIEMFNDMSIKHGIAKKRIADPKLTYLCEDESATQEYYVYCDREERQAGLKPDSMPFEHCPALVAESALTRSKWAILDGAVIMLDMDMTGKELNHRLLCQGIETYEKFIELCVSLVVNL